MKIVGVTGLGGSSIKTVEATVLGGYWALEWSCHGVRVGVVR